MRSAVGLRKKEPGKVQLWGFLRSAFFGAVTRKTTPSYFRIPNFDPNTPGKVEHLLQGIYCQRKIENSLLIYSLVLELRAPWLWGDS